MRTESATSQDRWLQKILKPFHPVPKYGKDYFQQVSDLVTTGFLSTTEYGSKSLHSPIRPWQTVSHLISTISSNYMHQPSRALRSSTQQLLQVQSVYIHILCLQILVGAPSTTALLQHGIPFLLPSKLLVPI